MFSDVGNVQGQFLPMVSHLEFREDFFGDWLQFGSIDRNGLLRESFRTGIEFMMFDKYKMHRERNTDLDEIFKKQTRLYPHRPLRSS